MNIKALEIRLGARRIGVLFQYAVENAIIINRFVADEDFVADPDQATLSLSLKAADPAEQQLIWRDIRSALFNGTQSRDGHSWLLPPFFQNLLPEGVFRDQLAHLRGCAPNDHFELLAASGRDLPGNVYAMPVELSRNDLGYYVTQNADALEMTVTADPLPDGVSISGVQPKLGVIRDGDRYVGRTKDRDTHIIAKLPVIGYPLLPEVEELSLRLARAAGVNACEAYLAPLRQLAVQHHYELGPTDPDTRFLAVRRYDRHPDKRIHCEDFAQIFSIMPEDKYSLDYSCLAVAATLMSYPSLGEAAVHELLRRLVVNEMLGNPDMHLKNIGVWYPDGKTPELPPAYDIVAHAIYTPVTGHGLRLLPRALEARLGSRDTGGHSSRRLGLSPAVVRIFCEAIGIMEKPATKVISDSVKAAGDSWPAMIRESNLLPQQKTRLLDHFHRHPMVAGLLRRRSRS